MSIDINDEILNALRFAGVSIMRGAPFSLPVETVFEAPCSLKWMDIGYALKMGAFSYAVTGHYNFTSIGRYTSIGESVQVGRGNHPLSWASTSPLFYMHHTAVLDNFCTPSADYAWTGTGMMPEETVIGNDVYIGHGAWIKQGVRIGDGAVVAACAVVTKDVAPYAIVAGNPATVKKFRFDEHIVEGLLKSRWWEFAFWDIPSETVSNPLKLIETIDRLRLGGVQPYQPKKIRLSEFVESLRR